MKVMGLTCESWASHAWRNTEQIREKRKLSPNMIAFREQSLKNAYLVFNPESSVLYVNVEENELRH